MPAMPTDALVNFHSRDERSKHFLSGCRLYEVFARERARKRGAVTCNKCDCFINLSACVGRREKPRSRTLSVLDRRREKERVKRDSRAKGHISEIFLELEELRPETESGSPGLSPRVVHYISTCTMPTWSNGNFRRGLAFLPALLTAQIEK